MLAELVEEITTWCKRGLILFGWCCVAITFIAVCILMELRV